MKQPIRNVTFDSLGCDFVLDVPVERPPRLLQITDMQVIDSHQRRRPDRLFAAEISCWEPHMMDVECFDHIRSVVAQTRPDMIFITGDIVYGEFDDAGTSLMALCNFMDSLEIPWAPVYGNHDNESAKGVLWQNRQFENATYCLYRRGPVHGNSNYTVGLTQGGKLIRVMYMMDSNCCGNTTDPEVYRHIGFAEDQYEWLDAQVSKVRAQGNIPGFLAMHLAIPPFAIAEQEKGYQPKDKAPEYAIGITAPAKDGDFGCKREHISMFQTPEGFLEKLQAAGVDGVFVGHCHSIDTSIYWKGIRWTFGLKTGQYDSHIPGHLGGTLVVLHPEAAPGAPADNSDDAPFVVSHVPALTFYGPFPKGI